MCPKFIQSYFDGDALRIEYWGQQAHSLYFTFRLANAEPMHFGSRVQPLYVVSYPVEFHKINVRSKFTTKRVCVTHHNNRYVFVLYEVLDHLMEISISRH